MSAFLGKIFNNRVLGIAYILVLVGGIYLTYAIFTKQFSDYDEVTLKADSAGLQLPSRADVKLRGKFVGEVLDVTANDEGATITLGMYPDEIDRVPGNVSAAIVPKTLFGEKYIDLRTTDGLGGQSLAAGDVIKQADLPTEIEDVLGTVYPLLRTVEPAEINFTLNALATALEGRGDTLGEGLVTANNYLKRLNPELPQAIEDVRLLGDTSDVYAFVLPELGTLLRNSVVTLGTVEDRETQLRQTLNQVSSLAGTAQTFLENNGDNLITAAKLGRTQTAVLARQSPIFQCMLSSIVKATPLQAEAFRNYTLHINLEVLENQPRGFTPADDPVYGDDRRPGQQIIDLCLQAQNGRYSQGNLPPRSVLPDFNDGVNDASLGKRAAVNFDRNFSGSGLARLLSDTTGGAR